MILVDANILLYAYDSSSDHHRGAKKWWAQRLSGEELTRLSWATIHAFLRIATHHRVFANPMTTQEAVGVVESWLNRPGVDVLIPQERYWDIFSKLVVSTKSTGNLIPDAHLAALAIEHGAALYSTDHDFSRFPKLNWKNPLSS